MNIILYELIKFSPNFGFSCLILSVFYFKVQGRISHLRCEGRGEGGRENERNGRREEKIAVK